MNPWTKGMWSAVLAAFGVAIGAQAAEPPKVTPPGVTRATDRPAKAANNAVITTIVNDATCGAGLDEFEYVGAWTHDSSPAAANNYGGDGTYSQHTGDYLRVKFLGTRIRLFGCQAPHHGVGLVSVDGGTESEADFRAPAYKFMVLVYESPILPYAEHVLRLRVHKAYSTPDYVEIDTPRGTPTTVEIVGPNTMLVPTQTGSTRFGSSAKVVNDRGIHLYDEKPSWSLQSPVRGVAIDPSSGIVTVDHTAVVGESLVVIATAGNVQGSRKVLLAPATLTQTLTTDDTRLTITVGENQIFISALKNPQEGWDWVAGARLTAVPLPTTISGQTVKWEYVSRNLETTNGTRLTLTFASTAPKLELQSVWRARPGVGPVEHQISVLNNSDGPIVFQGDDVEAANLNLVADKPVQFFPFDAGNVGHGESTPLPYQIVKVGSAHGIYFAYDYGCGQYKATRDPADPLRVNCRFWVGNKTSTTISVGETFHLPGIMIQTYQGDEDDAANHFRKWFWNYEITPSLRNNPNEPPIEICNPPGPDGQPDFLVNQAKTNDFASWGVGCLKTDFWYGTKGFARSEELAAALHAKGIKLALYFSGSCMAAKTDDSVAMKILMDEWNKSHYDYYRSDIAETGHPLRFAKEPFVDLSNYHSVQAFNRRLDSLAKIGVGWENCAAGGNIRSLDVCRRMTFMTHSDHSGLIPFFVHVYHWSYVMPPIQIKNDYWVCEGNREEGKVTVAWLRGNLLGAILTGPPTSASFMGALDKIKMVFQLYNTKQRAILRGADVYRILPPPANKQWFGLQYYNTFINKGSVLLWQNGGPASQVVKLKGLDRGATYQLTFEDAKDKNGPRTGSQLMDEGLNIKMGTNASEIVWLDLSK